MDTKSFAARIAWVLAVPTLALASAGAALASGSIGTRLDTYCAARPAGTTIPQQSRPYRASGSSCALCHPAGGGNNANNLNAAGVATRSAAGAGYNPFCINTAPTGTPAPTITAPASVSAGNPVTFTGSGGTDPDGFTLSYNWTFNNGIAPATGASVTVTPTAAGTLTATLEVRDANSAAIATRPTRSVTVQATTPPPAPPVANADTYSVQSGQTLTVAAPGLLGNDTNPAGTGTLTAQVVTNPASGTLTLNANGGFSYTPTIASGSVTFTYRTANGTTTSGNATVTINVTAPQPPVANADSYSVQSGQNLTVAAPGVLGNDTNPAGTGTLTAQLVTGPVSGTLTLNANGGFSYTPTIASGPVSFTYRTTNGTTTSANATVTINVSAAPTPPVATNETYAVQSGQTLTVAAPGLLGNDTNPAGTGTLTAQVATNPASGTLTLNANGGFSYTPTITSGQVSFTYRATNGTTTSANATVTINVTAPPQAPVANADTYSVQSGQTLTVAAPGLLGNDTNPAGTGTLTAQVVTNPASGTLTLNANGGFSYTPTIASGSVTFTYRTTNGTTTSANATVTINVSAAPPPPSPVANGETYSVRSDQTLNIAAPGLLANDTNPAGTGTLTVVVPAAAAAAASGGTVTLNANGSFSFTPTPGATSASFTYRVTNGTATSAPATVNITVTPAPPPPPPPVTCTDADRDGYFAEGGVCGPRDCNDSNAAINPGAVEVCGDSIDNDCDGATATDKECNGTDCLARFFAAPVVITSASWDSGDRELDVRGSQAQAGAAVTILNANSGALIGTAVAGSTGSWRFEEDDISPAPCRVRVAINGQSAERVVSGAPATCSVGTPPPPPATNQAPNGTISSPAGNVSVAAGGTVNFQGSGTDPDSNTPLTYLWNFGGGATNSTAQNPGNVQFNTAGTFTVTFTVRDATLADPTPATRTVTVTRNQAPQGTIIRPTRNVTVERGNSVSFQGIGSDPDGNTPLSYSWNFGGGATNSTLQNPRVRFNTNGTFTVRFTVRDARGLADPTPATLTVTVVDDD